MTKLYFIKIKDTPEKGPYTEGQLKGLWERAEITADACYYCEGMNSWEPLLEMMEESGGAFAPADKQPLKPLPRALPSATASNKDDVLFTDNLYTVTRNRFITPGQTYSMRNITSVKYTKSTPNYGIMLFCVIVGVLITIGGFNGGGLLIGIVILGAVSAGLFYIIKLLKRPVYNVCLITTAGEVSALESKDGEYTTKIVSALNKAIAQH